MIKQISLLSLIEISMQVKKCPMTLRMILPILLAIVSCTESSNQQLIRPVSLRCEYQVNPKGIDISKPSLSWLFETAGTSLRGQKQSAYQVLVASRPEILARDSGDLWNSGLVKSDQSIQVLYNGLSLNSRARCFWKVRVSDIEGNLSKWSAVASWEMGLLKSDDWQGSWIGAKDKSETKPWVETNGYCSIGENSQDVVRWVQIDLGEIKEFDKIILHPSLPTRYPDGAQIQRTPGFGFPLRFRIDVSGSPGFEKYKSIADKSYADITNPESKEVEIKCPGQKSRFVRLTATKLWDSHRRGHPFLFALGELQVISGDEVISLKKAVLASDSSEGWGWSKNNLTDGLNLVNELEKGHGTLLIRKETEISQKVQSATAFICGLGYYELYINGRKVGDHVLDPGFTDYNKRVLYNTYDVTDYLKSGLNCLGVMLGGGWFDPATPDAWGFQSAPWVAPPELLLNVILEFADGTKKVISTDGTWKLSGGPIVFNSVRSGEIYDARLEEPDWNLPGYPDTHWKPVKVVSPPPGRLESQQMPAIRATRIISPVKLSEPLPGVYVYDFGVNTAGWVRFKVNAEKGDTITFFHNEQLNPDGTVLCGPHSWWTYGPYQTDKFISGGKPSEVYEPRFTYHGFRYVQVNGMKKRPLLNDMESIWVHTDPDTAGTFSCSNPDINKVQELIIRTQLNNLHSIPTDCPHREKIGWMGDGLVTMEEAIYNFDMVRFYSKWFDDMMDGQEANGHVPPIIPNPGWIEATTAKNPDGRMPDFTDIWWGGTLIMTPWYLYQYYGDRRYLEAGYDCMKAYIDWLDDNAKNYIIRANLGDWIEPAVFTKAKQTPKEQVGTSAFFFLTRLMGQVAALLDKPSDAEKFNALAGKILNRYNEEFFDAATGIYAEDSQTAHVIPLLFDMVPEGKDKLVEQYLIGLISKNNNHLNTGFIGTPLMFRLLSNTGYADLAYTMATQEDQPGWFYMLRNGATTIWEVWDAIAQVDHSRDHPAFGSIGAWYYQSLAGIQPDPEGPGFKKIIIKPDVAGDLTWAKASYRSIHGKISSDWRRDKGKFILNIEVPVNTSATVYIPADGLDSILEGKQPAAQSTHISYLKKDRNKYVFEVGSGTYQFISNYP